MTNPSGTPQTQPPSLGWPRTDSTPAEPPEVVHRPGWAIPGHEPEPQPDDPSSIRNPRD